MFAQSVGGGGGHGASAGAHANGGQVNATVNVGGSGGTGGNGGSVTVENDGLIVTGQMYDLANPLQQDLTKFVAPAVTGGESHGIHAQSIGGGGGVGGNADPHSSAVSSIIADLINGKYETAGLYALGLSTADINDIKAGVSILKWGLLGSAPTNFSFSPTVNVGGTGGSGGNAGTVVTSNQGLIRTFGHRSFGVLAHSIGGGGGVAGSVNGALIDLSGSETMNGFNFNPSINVGGAGGVAGDGGDVSFTSTNQDALIVTHGYASYGIALQSIGGGGGIAHEGSTFGISDTVGLDSDVSVTGGLTFGGGRSSASYDAQAHSANASGSIGFGSGNVKKGDDVTVNYKNSGRSGNVTLGTASAPAKGSVVTHGDDAMAIFAQTVSGGGGLATLGCSNSSASSGSHYASACWGNPNVQGSAGQVGAFVGGGGTSGVQVNLNSHYDSAQTVPGGKTGNVNIYTEQHITTYGARSMGLVAQNITGGGGFFSSANSRIHSVNMPTQQRVTNPTGDGTTAVNIQLTGSTITTHGDGAWGLLSQSAVGGGGFFGDASKDLAFNVKYDQNNAAASDVFAAGNRPLSITEVKFGRHQVSDLPVWYGPCGQSNTCKVGLTPGENYKMPYQNGKVSWDVGDYLQLSKSDDAGYPYTVTQFKEDGSLKESLGNGRIELMQDGAFIFTASGPTGTMFRGDGLITGDQYTVHGIYQPTVAKIDEFAAANFYTVPLDVVGGSVSKFSRPQVAAAHFWNTTACRDTNTCSIGQVVGGQPDLIPYSSGQVAWEEGDYIQIRASTDLDHPYLIEQYAGNGTLKQTVGTGKILNLGEQYFFVAGSDTTYPQGGGDGTGFVFGASAVTATSLSLTGIINPTLAQVNDYLRRYYSAAPALASVVNQSYLPNSAIPDNWATGATKVQLTDSHVRTYGTNAHGMVIQNLGSVGGAWSSRGEKLTMGVSLVGTNHWGMTPGGKVDLTLSNSSVAVYGPRSRGVVIQTDGGWSGGYVGQAQIKVALSNGSSIFSAQHTALMLVGGSYSSAFQNTITVDSSSSITSGLYQQYQGFALDDTDATYNKWAVYAPTGYTNLTNDGTITGNILLGIVTKGDFVNNGTWQGSTAVAATNSLHNYGTIYAGGDGTVGGLHIEGALKHYEGGEIHLDVHPAGAGASHDVITVTGLARIEGEIVPQTKSLLPGNYQFLTAGTLEHSGSVRDAHVFSWDATVNGNTLIKTPTANFAPAGFGLSGNQASLAGYLQRGWDSGEGAKAALFGYLHEHEFGAHGDYQATLDQLMGQTLNVQPIQFQTAFSTYLGDSLSCPTVTQQGLKLNQDNCAWAKVTGDITEQSSNSANPGYHATGGGIRVGAQRSVGEGWTAGFGAGYGLNYLTSSNFSSNGQFFDLSLSVKKQIEQWTFGASLGFAQGWFDNNRSLAMVANGAADPMSALFSSKSRMTMAGLRWRAAFEHAIDEDQYLKPYVDVDLVYGYTPGYSETGAGKLGLNVGSNSRWNVAITPMLEYGLDVVTEDKSRVKLFVSAGASFLPNNTHKNQVSFQGVSSGLGTFDVITDGPDILGRLNLGIQAFHSENVEVRAQYGLLLGDGYLSQSVTANLTWRF